MSESIWFTDSLMRVHITPEDTRGAYTVTEVLAPSGHQPSPHVHDEDESVLVLEGELTVHTNDGATVLRPGHSGHVPAGEPHTVQVTSSEPVRAVIVTSGPGFVGFIRGAGRPAEREALPVLDGPPDVALLAREAQRNGTALLGPPGVVPADLVEA